MSNNGYEAVTWRVYTDSPMLFDTQAGDERYYLHESFGFSVFSRIILVFHPHTSLELLVTIDIECQWQPTHHTHLRGSRKKSEVYRRGLIPTTLASDLQPCPQNANGFPPTFVHHTRLLATLLAISRQHTSHHPISATRLWCCAQQQISVPLLTIPALATKPHATPHKRKMCTCTDTWELIVGHCCTLSLFPHGGSHLPFLLLGSIFAFSFVWACRGMRWVMRNATEMKWRSLAHALLFRFTFHLVFDMSVLRAMVRRFWRPYQRSLPKISDIMEWG